MSYRTRVVAAGVASLLLGSASCMAATQCPPDPLGHELRKIDGVSLFDGNPSENVLLAPSRESFTAKDAWWNEWTFRPGTAAGVTVVCGYEGVPEARAFTIPKETVSCHQDPAGFSCK